MEAAQRAGLNLMAPLSWSDQLQAAGFTDIHVKWYNWPIGPWAKQKRNKIIGDYVLRNMYEAVEAPSALFTKVLGWSIEDVQALVAEVREEHKQQKVPLYYPVCFCFARKPDIGEVHTTSPKVFSASGAAVQG
jgi:hypothetical protein